MALLLAEAELAISSLPAEHSVLSTDAAAADDVAAATAPTTDLALLRRTFRLRWSSPLMLLRSLLRQPNMF